MVSATKRTASGRPVLAENAPIVRPAIAAVRHEADQVHRDADRPTDPAAEARPAEIATDREWAERTIPPKRWMD